MSSFEIAAILLTLTAAFSYLNYRFIRLPATIGLMFLAMAFSLVLITLNFFGIPLTQIAARFISQIDFHETLMSGMLSSLLFAGSLHVNSEDLSSQRDVVGILSTLGILISTGLVGALTYGLFLAFHLNVPFLHCLLFGALISPTDPISVLGLLKTANISKEIQATVAGESLFNDGIGVVVFIVLSQLIASPSEKFDIFAAVLIFSREAMGGAILGWLIGRLAFILLKSIDNYKIEILLTIAVVTGGYALANRLRTSGPIAMVVAGLLIGNQGRKFAMSQETKANLLLFWGLIDDILNAVLFVLLGLEILVIAFPMNHLMIYIFCIPIVLLARWISVAGPIAALRPFRKFSPNLIKILTWGGLRGAISVALVLSLPVGPERSLLIGATYTVVVFSVIGQGLTFGRFIKHYS